MGWILFLRWNLLVLCLFWYGDEGYDDVGFLFVWSENEDINEIRNREGGVRLGV